MKRITILAAIAVMGLLAQTTWATIDFGVLQAQPIVVSPGSGTFTVTLTLNITQSSMPSNISGYDAIFEAAQNQNGGITNGQFNVTGSSTPPSQPGWLAIASYPDSLTLVGTDHTGFVQTGDEGYAGNNSTAQTINTPISGLQLATYTFSYSGVLAGQTYNFQTTLLSTSAGKFSDVTDTAGSTWAASSRALFSITTVPEPATWSLFGLGTLGAFGLNLLRARRKG